MTGCICSVNPSAKTDGNEIVSTSLQFRFSERKLSFTNQNSQFNFPPRIHAERIKKGGAISCFFRNERQREVFSYQFMLNYFKWQLFYLRWRDFYFEWQLFYLRWQLFYLGWRDFYLEWQLFYLEWQLFYFEWQLFYTPFLNFFAQFLCNYEEKCRKSLQIEFLVFFAVAYPPFVLRTFSPKGGQLQTLAPIRMVSPFGGNSAKR